MGNLFHLRQIGRIRIFEEEPRSQRGVTEVTYCARWKTGIGVVQRLIL